MPHGVGANDVNLDRRAAYRQEQTIDRTKCPSPSASPFKPARLAPIKVANPRLTPGATFFRAEGASCI